MSEATTQPEKPKRRLFQKIGKVFAPLFRGALKSVPIAGPLIELVQNIRAEFKGNEKKHSYISIAIQLISVGLIVYAFVTKQITIDQVLELLKTQTPTE